MTVKTGVAQAYYIHADHLNTPRQITDASGNVVWRWDNTDPFGNNVPNENPAGAGQFGFNLRFPGQYFDRETNTHYNVNRDYDPATGRYKQFDLIGLLGGINGYIYVDGNPLSYSDQFGLSPTWTGVGGPNQYGAYPDKNGIYPPAPVNSSCVQNFLRDHYGDFGSKVVNAGNIQQYFPESNPAYVHAIKETGEIVAEKIVITKGPGVAGKAVAGSLPRVATGLIGTSAVLSGAAELLGAALTPFGTAAMDAAQQACTCKNSTFWK